MKIIRNKGFTLIELLVSMGIVAVLTGLAVFNFNQSRVRARDVQRKNDLSQLQKALEVYKIDNGSYPAGTAAAMQTTLIASGYIKKTFNDPKGATSWADYTYTYVDAKNYYLYTCLENQSDSSKSSAALCSTVGVSCACGAGSPPAGVIYILSQP